MNEEIPGFFSKLAARCESADTSLCIGLDPDPRRIPPKLGSGPEGIFRFCADIIEATSEFAAAYKPNLAFFEAIGVEGWQVLAQVLETIDPAIPIIIDAKRGDIGPAARHYARALFERLKADAVTVNPLFGFDSVEPFLEYENRGIYIVCMTTNTGAADFEIPNDLYLRIAAKAREWNTAGNIGLDAGASKPKMLGKIRAASKDLPILLPRLGGQGDDLQDLLRSSSDLPRHHLIFTVSRSILFASKADDYGHAARKTARYYRDKINRALQATKHD